jgi:hypothetical protein
MHRFIVEYSRLKALKIIRRLYVALLEGQRYNNIQNYYNRLAEISAL